MREVLQLHCKLTFAKNSLNSQTLGIYRLAEFGGIMSRTMSPYVTRVLTIITQVNEG